jgi:hypothetical protein
MVARANLANVVSLVPTVALPPKPSLETHSRPSANVRLKPEAKVPSDPRDPLALMEKMATPAKMVPTASPVR